jgi:ribosomal protein S18 acetylase RimI-like enzyme
LTEPCENLSANVEDRPYATPRLPTRVWYLELDELVPARMPETLRIERAAVPFGPLNRFFYVEIGRDFHWVDRLGWPAERWRLWAERVETWVAYDRGTPAGYAEVQDLGDRAEISFFGLLEPFRGRGIGGALLTRATERALELAGAVTVNTCELDGEHARRNYAARGFRVVEERVEPRGRT